MSRSGAAYELEAATHNVVHGEHANAGTGAAANSVLQATSTTAFGWTTTPAINSIAFAVAGTTAAPSSAPVAQTGTDAAGLNVVVGGGLGTGAGAGGSYVIATPTTLASGATAQTRVARVTISQGAVTTDAWTMTLGANGQLALPAGSATAPALTLGGEQTGMFLASAGSPRFSLSGTQVWSYGSASWFAYANNAFIRGNDLNTGSTGNNFGIRSGSISTVTDGGAGTLTVGGQVGTGAGAGGNIVVQTPTTLSTGTTAQTAVTRVTISQGAVTTDAWTLAMAANGRLTFASGGAAATPAIAFTGASAFIGTTDSQSLSFVTNGASRFAISTSGAQLNHGASGSATAPNWSGGTQSGTDIAGNSSWVAGGRGTGAGAPGVLVLATATTLGTGSTGHSLVARLTISGGAVTTDAYTITWADRGSMTWGSANGMILGASGDKTGFYGVTPVAQQLGGVTITNNITAGGTTNTFADFVGATYATDAATIRNNQYQAARKLKLITDALRNWGALQNADA